jgi:hypothetical protein
MVGVVVRRQELPSKVDALAVSLIATTAGCLRRRSNEMA